MLSQDLVKAALQKALSTGADYAEVFAEHTDSKTISMVSSKVDKIEDAVISGVGIRIFKGLRCVSGKHFIPASGGSFSLCGKGCGCT